ncbi:MAG TPA: PASTA domain-containing protein [Gemmatimonadales bacterium]|nr:PASTA domain-containing protein [Gemmatimonadales bacterium]
MTSPPVWVHFWTRLKELRLWTRIKHLRPTTVRGRDRLRIGLILAAAAVAGYMVTCVAYPAPLMTRERQVARVLGLPRAQAEKELTQQGFRAKVDDEEADPVIPAGHVVWQDPPPETALAGGALVHLTLSAGPGPVTVPDVFSFDVDQARQVMDAAGLRIGDVDSIPSSSEPGLIIGTRPAIGSTRQPGAKVDLLVSKGPADIRVPDVMGLKQEEARQRLEASGLRVGLITTRAARRNATGIVLEQRPAAGVFSPHEGRVNLVISN